MKLLPRQEEFFHLFGKIAASAVQAAEVFNENILQLDTVNLQTEQIQSHKKDASVNAQRLFKLLHKTFITPFDRYDIHRLNAQLYDIVNMINLVAQRFLRYQIKSVPPTMITLANICLESVRLVEMIVLKLNNLRHSADIMDKSQKIQAYESQADQLLIEGVASLLQNEEDVKNLIKLKEIYNLLESITDGCQEVAFIIEGIVLEYA